MRVCPECGAQTEAGICRADGCPTLDPSVLQNPPPDSDIGQVLAGKFRVLEIVGRGGMGVVYRAFQRDMRRTVALKLATTLSGDPAGAKRFLREVRVIAGLAHPNTVRVFDYGQLDDGRLFFTMEFLDGEPLSKPMRRKEPFDERRIIRIGGQVLKSLGEAHSAGIVHRDLSPENIFLSNMFGERDFVKVLDFGVAKGAQHEAADERLTMAGVFVGKPAYASPEQAEGQEELDGRSDLYSLGICFYQMLCGHVPFSDPIPMKILISQIREQPKDIREAAGRPIHPELAALVMQLLSKRREDRPANAGEVLAALQRIEEVGRTPNPDAVSTMLPTMALQTGSMRTAQVGGRGRLGLILGLSGLLLAGAAAGTWFVLSGGGSEPLNAAPAVEAPATRPAPAKAEAQPEPEPAREPEARTPEVKAPEAKTPEIKTPEPKTPAPAPQPAKKPAPAPAPAPAKVVKAPAPAPAPAPAKKPAPAPAKPAPEPAKTPDSKWKF